MTSSAKLDEHGCELLSQTKGYWRSQLPRRYGEVRDLLGSEITETDNPFGIVWSLASLNVHDGGGESEAFSKANAFVRSYTGQRNYAGFGLMDYHARFYSPRLGRFIQPDAVIQDLTNSQGWNRYTYKLNNPVKYVDPSGHKQILYDGNQILDTELKVRKPSDESNLFEYC